MKKMKTINEMTIEEKIGQLLWIGFQGYEFNDNLKYLIDKYKVGNIILFTRNIKDIKQLYNLNKEIHEYIYEKTNIFKKFCWILVIITENSLLTF